MKKYFYSFEANGNSLNGKELVFVGTEVRHEQAQWLKNRTRSIFESEMKRISSTFPQMSVVQVSFNFQVFLKFYLIFSKRMKNENLR